eukprot:m.188023 g.188023  ORF g.188023 m.188023 type:complete len:590 (+) comp32327_c1_seq3:136-1905(+)
MQHLALLVVGVAVVCAVVTAQQVPSIEALGNGQIQVHATDLILDDQSTTTEPVSMVGLMAEIVTMRASMLKMGADMSKMQAELALIKGESINATFDAYPTWDEMQLEMDATSEAVKNDVLVKQSEADREINTSVNAILARPDIQGLPETTVTVADLASNMKYVLAHSANVTKCATDGSVHVGDGTCESPVPNCPKPDDITGGSVALSSVYIIPGVTATYTCTSDTTFLLGPKTRVCSSETKTFSGKAPVCTKCAIANCDVCADSLASAPRKCSKCADNHDLSFDKSKCAERTDSMYVLGGRPIQNNGHNYVECEELKPNAIGWSNFNPRLPNQGSHGAAYMVNDIIYHISASVRYASTNIFSRLKKGSNSWERFPRTIGRVESNREMPFHAAAGSKLYLFGTSISEVFDPTTNKWTAVSKLPTPRSYGATAVVPSGQGFKIVCLGGRQLNNRPTATVNVFDTVKKTWAVAPSMSSQRTYHAASSYGTKVVVMGGLDESNNPSVLCEVLDIATNKWTTMTEMPHFRADMSSGPMPIFGSKIYIPSAHQMDNHDRTGGPMLVYDVEADTWGQGPSQIRKKGQYTIVVGSRS